MSGEAQREERDEPTQWLTVASVHDIPPGHAACISIDGHRVAIFNCDGAFFAVDDTCSHAEASLSEGELDPSRCTIECPLHGSTFDLRTGEPRTLPAVEPVEIHRIQVIDGTIQVALGEQP